MGFYLTAEQFNTVLHRLQQTTRVCAPKEIARRGRRKGKSEIRYSEILDFSEIIYDRKADFGSKELVYPVMQSLLRFAVTEVVVSEVPDQRQMLIFVRPCDYHAMSRLDQIFMQNGGAPEYYYARLREKTKFILMECAGSEETCFCASMGTNVVTDYGAAVRFGREGLWVEVRDESLLPLFDLGEEADFSPTFVTENPRRVQLPDIPDRSYLAEIIALPYWEQFNDRCILCGGCNTVCPTCSCFDTNDVIYNETSLEGERRRTWSSCMLSSYTVMAGGHGVRQNAGANTRFKTLHKIYDYKLRFGREHMCVGCGRCDMRCPKEIRFFETIG